MKPCISIIILNWKGWKDTIECLESLYQIKYPNYDVIIIDNKSEDDSLDKIQMYCEGKLKVNSEFFDYEPKNKPIEIYEYFQEELKSLKPNPENSHLPSNKKLTIIKNDKNYGFAEGNNIGIKYVLNKLDTEYILLLNNDTVVDKEFLNEMVKEAENNPKVGFLGPKTYYYDYNGKKDVINFAGGSLNLLKGSADHIGITEIDHNQYETRIVDYVEGSCLLIRKNVLEEIGLLETKYFSYWEDSDLCMRGLKKNHYSLYVAKSKIWHKISASSNNNFKIYYLTRNRIWFVKRYTNKGNYLKFLIYFFIISIYSLILYFFNKKVSYKCYLKGFKDGLFN